MKLWRGFLCVLFNKQKKTKNHILRSTYTPVVVTNRHWNGNSLETALKRGDRHFWLYSIQRGCIRCSCKVLYSHTCCSIPLFLRQMASATLYMLHTLVQSSETDTRILFSKWHHQITFFFQFIHNLVFVLLFASVVGVLQFSVINYMEIELGQRKPYRLWYICIRR